MFKCVQRVQDRSKNQYYAAHAFPQLNEQFNDPFDQTIFIFLTLFSSLSLTAITRPYLEENDW
jgi:hypothetical protein